VTDLVLDTSALVAYAAGSVDVGEPVIEVHNEGGRAIIPFACLVEAAQQCIDGDDDLVNVRIEGALGDLPWPTS
jgi:hypothetical protein